jgi:hypothetical protein
MSTSNESFPYQNKSLADMPGEVWKDIPGFEGSFQASNLGRIKSLDRIVSHPRLYQQFVRGQILSQSIAKNQNLKTGEPSIDLRVTMSVEHIPHYFNVRRLIYQTFIDRQLNYQKDKRYIINADGNGYNNRPENLQAVTWSEKQLRAIRRGRVSPSVLKTADRTHWKKNYTTSKPVAQYDREGNLIKQYPSVREAARQTHTDDKAIIQVAKGMYKQWNGFIWKYVNQ